MVWPTDGQGRREWKVSAAETRSTWERCYYDIGVGFDRDQLVRGLSEDSHGMLDSDL